MNRTHMPPADQCPLCPSRPGGEPSEIPAEAYDVVVFDNRFPSFVAGAPPPAAASPEPDTVVVEVEKAPPGLRVSVDGRPTTLPVRLPRGSRAHALRFEAPGRRQVG